MRCHLALLLALVAVVQAQPEAAVSADGSVVQAEAAAPACDCALLQNEVAVQSNRVQAIIQECNGKLIEAQVRKN